MGVCTKKYNGIEDSIMTECRIYPWVDLTKERPNKVLDIRDAAWDTGATQTLISGSVIRHLNLKPIGRCQVDGFDGSKLANEYLIHVGLPTGDAVLNIKALECDGAAYDVVIGMDIISKGDFCFTNKDNKSVFSFRLPSKEHIELKD